MVGYMPRPMPRYFVEKLNVFGGTHLSTQSPMQPTILILGFSQAPVRKQQIISADWPKTPLLTHLARNNRDCKNVENLPISPLICWAQILFPPAKTAASPAHPKGFSAFSGQLTSQPSLTRVREIRWRIIHEHKQNRCRSYDLPQYRWLYRLSSTRGPQLDRNQRCNGRIPCLPKISRCRQGGLRCVASKAIDRSGPLSTFGPKRLNIALHSFEFF